MNKIDIAYLRCLGYQVDIIGEHRINISLENEMFYVEEDKIKSNVHFVIPIGDQEETDKVLGNLIDYIKKTEKAIDKVNELLSVSEEEKQRVIFENFDKVYLG